MSDIEAVKVSYSRCLIEGNFLDEFYKKFLASHPEIAPKFAKTDFEKQRKLLKNGINFVLMFAQDKAVGKSAIREISISHSKSKLDIDPKFYPYWKNSLIQTISEFDKEFTDELKKEWEQVLQKAINYIIETHNTTA